MEKNTALTPPNSGIVVSVRRSVVEARFDQRLPTIHTLLHAGDGGCIVIEVLAQRDARHMRGMALPPTQGIIIEHARAALASFQSKPAETAESES